ncbi:ATP-binding protein [Nocardioides plantarum]|uniref:histidine kinase n=1 Tax=Nocardioides plantarum TaxID=29299 RepID=A0ABV5KEM6_9ACTN|nr:ATP-binding protein [Nocardioides plantarum]
MTSSTERLVGVLSEFARTLLTDYPVQDLLEELIRHAVDLLPIDAAGVSLISQRTRPRMVASRGPAAAEFEQLQTDLDEGPCIAAYSSEHPILVPDLAVETPFPRFAKHAREAGLAAVFAFPLRSADRRVGALDLYRTSAGDLDPQDLAVAQTLADVATVYVLNAEDRIARTEFVSSVSHELRTPMTSIGGYTELLSDETAGALSPRQRQFVEAIERNTRRAAALASDLLVVATLESRAPRPHVSLDLVAVAHEAHDALEASIAERDVSVEFDIAAEPLLVEGRAEDLERVVVNLVGNALKFTPDGGHVRCSVSRTAESEGQGLGSFARIEVSDDGVGIPEDEQPQLFTRFFRSSTAETHQIQGTGLGLHIVATIVREHHGRIGVRSQHQQGSTFTVDLPTAD